MAPVRSPPAPPRAGLSRCPYPRVPPPAVPLCAGSATRRDRAALPAVGFARISRFFPARKMPTSPAGARHPETLGVGKAIAVLTSGGDAQGKETPRSPGSQIPTAPKTLGIQNPAPNTPEFLSLPPKTPQTPGIPKSLRIQNPRPKSPRNSPQIPKIPSSQMSKPAPLGVNPGILIPQQSGFSLD